MKRNELWLGGLLAVAGFFGACTNVVEDESQNNKYPMELMAEKSAITCLLYTSPSPRDA